MAQIPGNQTPTVLCLESAHSHFAASEQIFKSGIFDVVSATNVSSAIAALRSIRRIRATVVGSEIVEGRKLGVVAEINVARPELPKIVIAPPPPVRPPEILKLTFVDSVLQVNEELRRLLAFTCAQLVADRQNSAELRAESRYLREETRWLREETRRLRAESKSLREEAETRLRNDPFQR